MTAQIYTHAWTDVSSPKGAILLVHGLGEHCHRYEALGNYFNQNDYVLYSLDLPNHGQSVGQYGHVDQFSDFTHAVLNRHKELSANYPDKPIFLLGHSMGGLITTQILLDHENLFAGALLSGAAIQSPQTPPAWQIMIMKVISRLFPKMGMLALDATQVSRDQQVVQAYQDDPLIHHGKLSARLLIEMFNAMDDCRSRAANISLPIRIMHGGADAMTAPQGSQLLFDSISSKDKSITVYDGLFHEIFNEPEASDIYAQMVAWLDQRI